MTDWHVYIVRCADRSLYTGVATDVAARIASHNAGKGAKYTRGRRPVRLVYQERVGARGAALRREFAIKRLTRAAKRRLVSEYTQQQRSPPRPAAGTVRSRRR
jgi:putative endonuclease